MQHAEKGPDVAPATKTGDAPVAPVERGRAAELFRTTVAPLFLLLVTPPAVLLLWVTNTRLDGSLSRLLTRAGLATAVSGLPRPTWTAAEIIVVFLVFELALLHLLPGRIHEGPVTPTGQRPRYRLNGVPAWFVTHAAFVGASAGLGWFSPGIVYEHFGELLSTLCASSFLLCWLLYFKGIHAPSTSDAGSTGNPIMDYFWGVELHPSVLGTNLKQLINCRIGMMGWSLSVVSFAFYQARTLGHVSTGLLVSVAIQVVYLFEFFCWEDGYFASLDVMHDRMGYYICWGVLAWVPGVYTIAAQCLAERPRELSLGGAVGLLALGLGGIWAGHAADAQRKRVRETDGHTTVWGRAPGMIRARYTTEDGTARENILLTSGFWGIARHFHYLPELGIALALTLPNGTGRLLPFVYPIFLAVLLVDRANRDDLRCAKKYGPSWDEYRRRVPYRILPGIY